MTIRVKLRRKAVSNGKLSLYLDIYPPVPHPSGNKLTRREFLRLYIPENPKTYLEKHNVKETLKIAEAIRLQRENNLNKPEVYNEFEKERMKAKELGQLCYVQYFKQLANTKKGSNSDNWVSTYHYLKEYTGGSLKFADLNEGFLESLKRYLQTAPSRKSKKLS